MNRALLLAFSLIGCAGETIALESDVLPVAESAPDALQGGGVDRRHPAVGLVWIKGQNGLALCTGTLVAADLVLTAAHCAREPVEGFYLGTGRAFVDIGDPAFLDGRERHAVDRQLANPDWTGDCSSQRFDLALLHLAEPIDDVRPATLATVPQAGVSCTAVGYGAHTYPDRTASGEKRQGLLELTALQESRLTTKGATAHTDTGDSGGPLFCSDRVVATVSCGNEHAGTTTYARVDAAIEWIRSAATALRQAR